MSSLADTPTFFNDDAESSRTPTDWLDRNDLLAFLPDYIVDRILKFAAHCDFSGDPVVPADELNDKIALAQRDFDIREANR